MTTNRLALEAVAVRVGLDLGGVEIVPIGGAQAIRRAVAEHVGERVVGLCDHNEERFFRGVLGDATFVCVEDIEDELIRVVGVPRAEELLAAQGELATFRNFQNQAAWRGRTAAEGLPRWLQSADRRPLPLPAVPRRDARAGGHPRAARRCPCGGDG